MSYRIFSYLLFLSVTFVSAAPVWKYAIIDSMEHPKERFTQGLSWSRGELFETTGLVGKSKVYRMDRNGKVLKSTDIAPPHFGEGSVVVGGDLVVLTWRSGLGFVFDAQTLAPKGEFSIPGEGWGLCLRDGDLWLSNGSSRLLRLHPESKDVTGFLEVRDGNVPVSNLNELESAGNFLLANIWYSDSIAIIQPQSGNIVAYLDLSKISQGIHKRDPHADVLNGMAWDGKHLWVTGKLWPKIYVLEIPMLSGASASGIPKTRK